MKVSRSPLVALAVAMTMAMLVAVSLPAIGLAQSEMQVKIPFDFYVGTQLFPSGSYSVQVSGNYLKVSDRQGHSAFALTNAVLNPEWRNMATGKLMFTRYDNYYFLSEVRRAGYTAGNGLIRSNLEARIAKNSSDRELLAFGASH